MTVRVSLLIIPLQGSFARTSAVHVSLSSDSNVKQRSLRIKPESFTKSLHRGDCSAAFPISHRRAAQNRLFRRLPFPVRPVLDPKPFGLFSLPVRTTPESVGSVSSAPVCVAGEQGYRDGPVLPQHLFSASGKIDLTPPDLWKSRRAIIWAAPANLLTNRAAKPEPTPPL